MRAAGRWVGEKRGTDPAVIDEEEGGGNDEVVFTQYIVCNFG